MIMTRLRAFTLVEVLITVALSVVLLLAITQLYVVYSRMTSLETASIGVSLSASSIMDTVHSAGLEALHIIPTHTFSGTFLETSATTSIFELQSIDASGSLIEGSYDYIGVYATGTNVYRVIDAAPGSSRLSGVKLLTSRLEGLTFAYDNADPMSATSFTVDATTSAAVHGKTTLAHLREHIHMRNL